MPRRPLRPSRRWREPGYSTCLGYRPAPAWASSPAPLWPTSQAWLRPADLVLVNAGWDVHRDGLTGAPKVNVLVGAERHVTVDLALRYLGLGRPTVVAADDEGRVRADALVEALGQVPSGQPLVMCLQAGNVRSGAFDPFSEAIALVHERGGWVHVDGAFSPLYGQRPPPPSAGWWWDWPAPIHGPPMLTRP